MTFTLLPIPVLSSVFKSAVTGVTDAMLCIHSGRTGISRIGFAGGAVGNRRGCLFICIALCQCIIVFDLCQNIASVFKTSGIGIDTLHVF